MPLLMVRNDITKIDTDAVVTPADEHLEKELKPGRAKISRGQDYCSAEWHIQTEFPKWQGGDMNEAAGLYSSYLEALRLAAENDLRSIAFPLLATGKHGYPKAEALNIANHAIMDFLKDNEMDVYLVLYTHESVLEGNKLYRDIKAYIDDNYVEENHMAHSLNNVRRSRKADDAAEFKTVVCDKLDLFESIDFAQETEFKVKAETFHEMLFRLIEESGKKNSEVYKAANMSKQLFSKIKSNVAYIPTKKSIISLAIGLNLDLDATNELLMTEGYILTDSLLFDTIVMYFIEHENYNILDINEALWDYEFEDKDLFGYY